MAANLNRKGFVEGKQGIALRSLQPKKDVVQLAKKGNKEEWIQVYQNILRSTDAHAWVIISESQIIGQLDIYTIVAGELGKRFPAGPNDAVIQYHFQPAVAKEGTVHQDILNLFMQYYFGSPNAGLLYAQTNIYDDKTCRLYESAGFIFQQNTMLTNQAASLYLMTQYRFKEQCKKKDS